MQYYAHFGHREFILCLGYRGELIEQYLVDHEGADAQSVVRASGALELSLHRRGLGSWKITLVETGLDTNVGQRLKAVERYLHHDSAFLANYADGLTDLALPGYLREYQQRGTIAGFVSVRPRQTFHLVSSGAGGLVDGIRSMTDVDLWINRGFFAFKPDIFKYIDEGEDLVEEPFRRLIAQRQLMTYRHPGFWACMDTFKDKQLFDEMNTRADVPWEVWGQPVQAASSHVFSP